MTAPLFAEIAVPVAVHGTFTYAIPEDLRDGVVPGVRVEVPWGAKSLTGFVVSLTDAPQVPVAKVREILALLDDDGPSIVPEILELCRWAAHYYLAPIGEMIRAALPTSMASKSKRRVRALADRDTTAEAIEKGMIPASDERVLTRIREGAADPDRLIREVRGARSAIRRLAEAGLIEIEEVFRDADGVPVERIVTLTVSGDAHLVCSTPQQVEVVAKLIDAGGEAPWRDLIELGASASALATLRRKGFIRVEKRARRNRIDPLAGATVDLVVGDLDHTAAQRAAIEKVANRLGRFGAFLLQGVTGSGKTEVYIELARRVVANGEQVIFLVPEIGLTPALAARLHERFGDRVAVLHSNLSTGERYEQWWRARRGEVDVAVGPRSALFVPFAQPGLMIVDEEGDGAYKQDERPRYNARDLAVVRARLHSIPVVLGSATPSLESRENAERGKYELIVLPDRVAERPLPEVEIVDLRKEKAQKEDRGMVIFSRPLTDALRSTFDQGEQAIILINRRGYAPFLLCRQCEHDFRCRDCSVTLTVHRREDRLICHYCGYRTAIPRDCPKCGGEVLQPIGFGTEKVEERFRQRFPEVPVEVIDRDSVRRRGALVGILERFRSGVTRALVGTQIISKGHDFPNVTLTGVINADSILGYPDFRSAEKTFYLLTQVAGRSGRGDRRGRVLIQTAFPDHYAITHAARHDYEAFYQEEIEFRRRFHYPPETSMIAILFRGDRIEAVERAATGVAKVLRAELEGSRDARIQGPAPAPLARIKGAYRYQILLRSRRRASIRKAVETAVVGTDVRGVEVVVDVDPLNIL